MRLTGGACARCGGRDQVVAHHVRPVAAGGGEDRAGVALCRDCHAAAERAIRQAAKRA